MKNSKNIIIVALLIVIFAMAVGYSAFATELTLGGTTEIIGKWDIKITKIEVQEISDGCDSGEPQFTNTTATFNAKLVKPGDVIVYAVTIENAGTIDATLNNVLFTSDDENGSPAIEYETSSLTPTLAAGEQCTFTVKAKYNSEITETPSVKTKTITGIVEYVQK